MMTSLIDALRFNPVAPQIRVPVDELASIPVWSSTGRFEDITTEDILAAFERMKAEQILRAINLLEANGYEVTKRPT